MKKIERTRVRSSVAPVVARHVSKRYDADVLALDGVDITLERGEFVALVGPSGCGKSTLLNLLGCIDLPTSGEIFIEGKTTNGLSDDALTLLRRDRIGTIFQFFNLVPTLTLEENIALPLVLQRRPAGEIHERASSVMKHVGLAHRARAFPAQLSGGEMQRGAIARAIIHQPAIVLADEPTGNLDSRNGAIVLDQLGLLAEQGQAVLMATHSEEAAGRARRRVRMLDGRILA